MFKQLLLNYSASIIVVKQCLIKSRDSAKHYIVSYLLKILSCACWAL